MNRSRILKCALVLTLFSFLSFRPVYAEFDFGTKYAGDYMSGQSSARLLGLGGVGVTISSGPSAILGNPALLEILQTSSVAFMHADRFESAVTVDHLAYVHRNNQNRTFGLGMIRQSVDNIPITKLRNPNMPLNGSNRVYSDESTSASEYAFMFAYASKTKYGMIGGSAKLLYKRLYKTDGMGLGIDLGYAKQFGSLTLGAQLRDAVTSPIAWEGGYQEAIKPTLRVGGSYLLEWQRLEATLLPVVDVEFRTESIDDDDAIAIHAGFEYTIRHLVSLRIGLDDDRMTYGAGLAIGAFDVQYAFIGHDDLGDTHRISLGIAWGK